MKVKIKKLHPNAVKPKYAKESDAGMDLVATTIISNTTFQVTYGIGLAIEIPDGMVGLIFPRSSIRNTELTLSNSVGVIDAGYRGSLIGMFDCLKSKYYTESYTRLLQICAPNLIPIYVHIVNNIDELGPNTLRGEGGFGSTGK